LDRLTRIKDSILEGDATMVSQGQEFAGELRQIRKNPNRFLFSTQLLGVQTSQVLDGDRAWTRPPGADSEVQELDSLSVKGLRSGSIDLQRLLFIAAKPGAPVARREHRRGDADAVEVIATDGVRRVLFLDPKPTCSTRSSRSTRVSTESRSRAGCTRTGGPWTVSCGRSTKSAS
jgi:hypothetical protein